MKYLLSLFFILSTSSVSFSQNDYDNSRYASMDSIMHYLYASISGDKGVKRDWVFFSSLFKDDAKLVPARLMKDGLFETNYLSPTDYIERAGPYLEENGFFEKEIHRTTEIFNNISHTFSTPTIYRAKF